MVQLSVTLENTQSVARDHLANERTFLAWVRTGLTFASVGVGLTQLFRVMETKESFSKSASTILGTVFATCGLLVLIVGTTRYFHVQSVLQTGYFPATRSAVWFSGGISLSVVVVALSFILKAALG